MSPWSDSIANGVTPIVMDTNFKRKEDEAYPWRCFLHGQYLLVPAIGIYAPFVLPLAYDFRTDGPSIPWYAQWAVPKSPELWPAAFAHDGACAMELFLGDVDTVNLIMKYAMDVSPVKISESRKKLVFWAIDKFCARTFKDHKPEIVKSDRELFLAESKFLWDNFSERFVGYGKMEEICPAF